MFASHFRVDRVWIGYAVCVSGLALTLWSFFPGAMSPDSAASLSSGRTGVYYDVNSPIFSYIWGRLDEIVPGPALMFVLQNTVFWIAAAVFWQLSYRRSIWLGMALAGFGFAPHILSTLTFVWKDVGMGAALFLAVALIYFARSKKSRLALFLSVPFLFFGGASRLNAVGAVLPIAIWSGFVAADIFRIGPGKTRPLFFGACYFVVLAAGAYWVTYSLTRGRTTYPFQQNYLYDLAAVSTAKGEMNFPEYIVTDPMFRPELVRERFNQRSISDLIYKDIPQPGDRPILRLTEDPTEIESLRSKWFETVRANPIVYLKHRAAIFAGLVGLDRSVGASQLDRGFADNPPEFKGVVNAGYRMLMTYFGAFRRPVAQTLFFRAFVWLAACCYFLYRSTRGGMQGDRGLIAALASSGLIYTAAYFPTAPSTEFRYLFWPAIASMVVIIFGIFHLSAGRRNPSEPPSLETAV